MNVNWVALPMGVLIATVVSAVGLGGGILWMPFFLLVMRMHPETAVLTSLMIQTAGMASGSIAYGRQGRLDVRLALVMLITALPGILAGACLSGRLTSARMELFLGILIMMTAFLFVSSRQRYDDIGVRRVAIRRAIPYSWVTVAAAIVTGMLSISMSEWLIPLMRSRLSLRMSSAIATSILITFGTCVVGLAAHLSMGAAAAPAVVAWAVPGVILGGQIGPRITQRIHERVLKDVFTFLLTLVGIHLIYNAC
jgi:uncharacterized membrane protein YfcA